MGTVLGWCQGARDGVSSDLSALKNLSVPVKPPLNGHKRPLCVHHISYSLELAQKTAGL